MQKRLEEYNYDIFVSYKNSTEKGLTPDRIVANDFSRSLKDKGFRVFFSQKTLVEIGTDNYMFEIQNALEGSRSIVVLFSDIKYVTSGWVAHEWMTFLNLLLNDSNRRLFIYSINNEIDLLPPFLRPYQCFSRMDEALFHIGNGLNNGKAEQEAAGLTQRDFLNAYWNLFGEFDIHRYLDVPLVDSIVNHDSYCLREKRLQGAVKDRDYVEQLQKYVEAGNTIAAYYLSRFYRDYRHLDLKASNQLAKEAYLRFCKKNDKREQGEVAFLVLATDREYDGAFYMCEAVCDVLDAYHVKRIVSVVHHNATECPIRFADYRIVVLLWSSSDYCIQDSILKEIHDNRQRVLIGLNAFEASSIRYDVSGCEFFDNSDEGITKMCRSILG